MESAKTDDWSCTSQKTEEIKYKWTIKDFRTLPCESGVKIQSPSFFSGDGEREWQLALYPGGCNDLSPDSVGLFVTPLIPDNMKLKIDFTLAIYTSKELIVSRNCSVQWTKEMPDWGYIMFLKRSQLLQHTKLDGSIVIHCEMKIAGTSVELASNSVSSNLAKSLNSQKDFLINDFESLLTDPHFSDFRIVVGDEIFHVHKNILAARSSTFAAMFKHENMEENRTNQMKIANLDSDVVRGMLEYIYTSKVKNFEELASGLLAAAEQYDLSGLKTLCMDAMCDFLRVENAADILIQADLYRASPLKEYTINFIKEHLTEVQSTESFQKISNAALLMELLLAIGKQDSNTNKPDKEIVCD